MERRLPKHSVMIAGHATSISLEPEFWAALHAVAAAEKRTVPALLTALDQARIGKSGGKPASSLASAARVYVLKHHLSQSGDRA